jgi:hypothetical protein
VPFRAVPARSTCSSASGTAPTASSASAAEPASSRFRVEPLDVVTQLGARGFERAAWPGSGVRRSVSRGVVRDPRPRAGGSGARGLARRSRHRLIRPNCQRRAASAGSAPPPRSPPATCGADPRSCPPRAAPRGTLAEASCPPALSAARATISETVRQSARASPGSSCSTQMSREPGRPARFRRSPINAARMGKPLSCGVNSAVHCRSSPGVTRALWAVLARLRAKTDCATESAQGRRALARCLRTCALPVPFLLL